MKYEDDFTAKAKQAGMTEEEAKYAFNSNMMSTGLLSEYPAEFAREHGRRWLTSAFEAGDVVLHKPHAVCALINGPELLMLMPQIHASTINHDPDNVIRLATDLRFCDSSRPYDKVCLVCQEGPC
jgi:phytanoyl-CoA hydroxylase